jgi:hypothetical protein
MINGSYLEFVNLLWCPSIDFARFRSLPLPLLVFADVFLAVQCGCFGGADVGGRVDDTAGGCDLFVAI